MDSVPQFCENLRFRKIIWEELHTKTPVRRLRARTHDAIGAFLKRRRNNTMGNEQ